MTFKTPKNTEFNVQGEAKTLVMVDVDETETAVTVEYGLLVATEEADNPGVIKGARYRLSTSIEFMGKERPFEAGGVDLIKAIDALCAVMNVDGDDVEFVYDESDEFFSQKYSAPKAGAADVWGNEKFAKNRDELESLRGVAEGALADANDSEVGNQEAAMKVSQTLYKAYELVGRSIPALKSWAEGAKDGENMSLLSQLGKGANALREALVLAQLPKAEYGILPASLTSGKGAETFGRSSIKAIVEDSDITSVMKHVDTSEDTADMRGVEVLIRQVASACFGVGNALENEGGEFTTTLENVSQAVDLAATNWAEKFSETYGKNASTYHKESFGAAKLAYGAVRVSTSGNGLFMNAVNTINAYNGADDDDADTLKKLRDSLFSKTGGNALVKEAYTSLKAHAAQVALEARNRSAMKAANDDKIDVKAPTWAQLEPLAAAAYLYSRIEKHAQSDQVAAALKSLMAQQPFVVTADKVAAE